MNRNEQELSSNAFAGASNAISPSHQPDRARLDEMERNHIGFLI
jgi:hypothetical protein